MLENDFPATLTVFQESCNSDGLRPPNREDQGQHQRPVVAYYRVSTKQQGQSGLGLTAQRHSVHRFTGQVVAEFTEVESGKCTKRPELDAAIQKCKEIGGILVVARLDRLARNVRFTSTLLESGLDFVACDMPTASRLTIHIMAAMAEEEARLCSERTKAGLAVARANGVKLGAARPGHRGGAVPRGTKRPTVGPDLLKQMQQLRERGDSCQAVADAVNAQGHRTIRGNAWDRRSVHRVLRAAA